jgi:hypothetical protein
MIKNRRFINYVNGAEFFSSQLSIQLVKKFPTVKNENFKNFLTFCENRSSKNPTTSPHPESDGSSTCYRCCYFKTHYHINLPFTPRFSRTCVSIKFYKKILYMYILFRIFAPPTLFHLITKEFTTLEQIKD